jgi:ubiquinol-cytochrome c reductase subunit 7
MAQALRRLTSLPVKSATFVSTAQPARNITIPFGIRKWMYSLSGYNQYGLYKDDCVIHNPVIEEAIRRLPAQVQDERNFRIARASQLSVMKTVLPKDQWPTYEDDLEKGRYLHPYIEEVEKEFAEQAEWNKQ